MCIIESHCWAAELKATLKFSHTSKQFLGKNKSVPWFSLLPVSFLLTISLFSLPRKHVLLWQPHNPHNPSVLKNYFLLEYS